VQNEVDARERSMNVGAHSAVRVGNEADE
jgi:hypothetical protein